jgi:hypothetical protein
MIFGIFIGIAVWFLWVFVPAIWGSLWYQPPPPPQISEAEQLAIDESIRALLERQAARKYRYWRRVGRWGWTFVIGVALFSGIAGAFHH